MVATGEINWDEDVVADPAESYESLERSLQRTEGFGLFFVRCVPGDQADLVQRLQADLPTLHMQRLVLNEELVDGNLYQRVATLPDMAEINVLFISGLEKSLDPYVKSGYGGQGDYYKLDTVPRVLGHLNLQRERFRDDFPFCLVFFLSAFGIKYIARRAPDFFDWRSGIFEFVPDSETVGKLTQELQGDYQEYLTWSHSQRMDRIREIQGILEEDQQTPAQQASLWFEKGNILFADENYEVAIASYDKAIEVKPDDDKAWLYRGHVLSDLKRYEEAIASYDKAIEIEPDYYEAWNARGITLHDLGRYEEAVINYDRALKLKSNLGYVWRNRGQALSALKNYEEAVSNFNKALRIKPDDNYAWLLRGDVLHTIKQYDDALASYNNALKIEPDKYAWRRRGRLLADLNQYQEAIYSFEKALEIDSSYIYAWNDRGSVLRRLKQTEEAVKNFNQALESDSNNYYLWRSRGIELCRLKAYEDALTSLDKALEIKPLSNDYADLYYTWKFRGYVLNGLKRYQEAIISFDKALAFQLDSNFFDRYYALKGLGFAFWKLGRYSQAIESFYQTIVVIYKTLRKARLNSYKIWLRIGANVLLKNLRLIRFASSLTALLKRWFKRQTICDFDAALKYRPDDYEAWYNLGNALRRLECYSEAVASYDKSLAIKPHQPDTWSKRGTALVYLSRYEEALVSYDEALQTQPDFAPAYYNKACCYGLQKNVDLAIENLQQSIILDSEYWEMAKTDSDFDGIRDDERFRAVIGV
ncbi:MAG: tetratricopeptide repeat protein [Stenomitos rutilans HA7619-LM2]|nr:tetratricopeptide repeat protein [Stenomitos rutilans HA7619-LM2]